jgi:hypothetical protein
MNSRALKGRDRTSLRLIREREIQSTTAVWIPQFRECRSHDAGIPRASSP